MQRKSNIEIRNSIAWLIVALLALGLLLITMPACTSAYAFEAYTVQDATIPLIFRLIRDHQRVTLGMIILIAAPLLWKVMTTLYRDFMNDLKDWQ